MIYHIEREAKKNKIMRKNAIWNSRVEEYSWSQKSSPTGSRQNFFVQREHTMFRAVFLKTEMANFLQKMVSW